VAAQSDFENPPSKNFLLNTSAALIPMVLAILRDPTLNLNKLHSKRHKSKCKYCLREYAGVVFSKFRTTHLVRNPLRLDSELEFQIRD